ncbi:hypothetical protein [Haloarchaeobius sp. HME9146]|uniref:hypothetical protein n=1 Tax=Haloarchaeobius sp. HME9146 TaxID=2978732 RepID=UPI0021BF4199|nr:hypothetical protein [Haloarchaeobius sp. HME9146]MCT9095445.1 hypothetical protein [Haloarchaeobius sp. HME9146]
MEFQIDGEILRINDSQISLRGEIKEVLTAGNVAVVLLKVPEAEIDNRNVLGINSSGDQIWEIDPVASASEEDAPFIDLVEREGEIWALNWRGDEWCISPETGEIKEKNFRRF